jgi:S-(hydroxymethyl)mycothiol dehydrogenase
VAAIRTEAVVARRPGHPSSLEEVVVDDPGPDEVRLRVLAAGVCHSDLHALSGHMGPDFPYVLGHECCGVVESVGAGVDPARIGERVVIFWRAPCGVCRFCNRGEADLCADVLTPGPRLRDASGAVLTPVLRAGTFVSHTVVRSGQAVPMDAAVPAEVAALIGCGVATGVGAALRTAQVKAGDRVAVVGCGAVGLSAVQGARLAGAAQIIAVDLRADKLELAVGFGATDTVLAGEAPVAASIRELTGGFGVDYCFDVVGRPETLAEALACCDDAGTAVLVGVPPAEVEFAVPLSRLWGRRRGLLTCWYGNCLGARDFPLLAAWYRQGRLKLDEMVSRRIALSEVEAAFADMKEGRGLRSVIMFDA